MITLTNTGNSIKFIFSGNTMYLNDGEIEVPYNSLTLITDESGMATFRRIDGDIFISARYEEFGMTKAQLEAWFKINACNSGGGGSGGSGMTPYEVQAMINESISGKAEYTYVDYAVSGKVDTSAFTAYSAATDAALEEKVDEAYVNAAVSGKVDTTTFTSTMDRVDYDLGLKADESYVDTLMSTKADTSAVTQSIEAAVSGKVDTSIFSAYTAATDTALSGKADTTDVAPLFGAVAYDSTTKHINFYHDSVQGSILTYVDASDFIKDGMVNNVEIKDVTLSGESVTCLVVSFNTDAGHEDINIPLSGIFNANNYYTKSQIDTALSGKADTSAVTTIADSLSGYVQTSDVTSAVTSGSTSVITSGGVYAQLGGLALVKLTQTEYDNLQNKDSNTLYVIVD